MSLTEDNLIMPVAPTGGFANGGFGGNMGDMLLFFMIAMMFGNGGWGGYGGGYGGAQLGLDFPWILNGQNNTDALISNGFQNAQLANQLSSIQTGITSGFGDVATQLCGGFAGVTASVTNAQNALASQMYSNQIADLERSFAAQTANMQGMNALQSQLATCCCENRAATQDVKYTIATEGCATRANETANTQAILDKLCQIELDNAKMQIEAKNDTISQLRSELMYARGQASQDVQTATIQAGQRALANEIEQTVVPTPHPAYIVQNPYTAQTYYGCGCGCGA